MSASTEIVRDKLQEKNINAFCLAAKQNKVEELKKLIAEVGDVNVSYKKGWTALHYACLEQSMEAVFYLIGQQGNLELRNDSNRTARSYLNLESVDKLINFCREEAKASQQKSADGKVGSASKGDTKEQAEAAKVKEISKPASAEAIFSQARLAAARSSFAGAGVTPSFNGQIENIQGEKNNRNKDLSIRLLTQKEAIVSFEDRTIKYQGTGYTITVSDGEPGQNLVFKTFNHGCSGPGYFTVGIIQPDKKTIRPLLELEKGEGFDFCVMHFNGKSNLMSAEIAVIKTPENYDDNPYPAVFPRLKNRQIGFNCEDLEWEEPNPDCYKYSHSNSTAPSAGSAKVGSASKGDLKEQAEAAKVKEISKSASAGVASSSAGAGMASSSAGAGVASSSSSGAGITPSFNGKVENKQGEKNNRNKDLNIMLTTEEEAIVSFKDHPVEYQGTGYTITVSDIEPEQNLVFKTFNHGCSGPGYFTVGIILPDKKVIRPVLELEKGEGFDFCVMRFRGKLNPLSAQIAVIKTPENYDDNPYPAIFPRLKNQTLSVNCKELEWEKSNPDCYKYSHSNSTEPSAGAASARKFR